MPAGDPVRLKGADFLPFVRYDTSAVPPQIKGGDHIYLIFTYSEAAIEGGEGVLAESKELKGSCVFRAWRKDGTNAVFNDGDDVFFEHIETGKYLEAATDTTPLTLADKDENSAGQLFGFFKQGRPMEIKHRDTVYIQSWLHHYVEYRQLDLSFCMLAAPAASSPEQVRTWIPVTWTMHCTFSRHRASQGMTVFPSRSHVVTPALESGSSDMQLPSAM